MTERRGVMSSLSWSARTAPGRQKVRRSSAEVARRGRGVQDRHGKTAYDYVEGPIASILKDELYNVGQRFLGHVSSGVITEIEDQCGTSGRVL